MGFHTFIHNKDQMYFPKVDEIFGSDYILVTVDDAVKKVHASATYEQIYKMRRTHWKSLDSSKKRCNDGGGNENITHCLTSYFERMTGCSMNLALSDPLIPRMVPIIKKKTFILSVKKVFLGAMTAANI